MTVLTIDDLDAGLEPDAPPAPPEPPAEVYRLLQVLPTAPRDLIDEAYWVLGARAMRMSGSRGQSARYIAALNWAYETAARALADQALYDEIAALPPEPPRRAWPRLFSRADDERPTPKHLSYYDVLCVQPYADAKIIELAAIVILRTSGGFSSADAAMRDLVRMARRVLLNPAMRGEHDLKLGLARPSAEEASDPAEVGASWPSAHPAATAPTANGSGPSIASGVGVSIAPTSHVDGVANVAPALRFAAMAPDDAGRHVTAAATTKVDEARELTHRESPQLPETTTSEPATARMTDTDNAASSNGTAPPHSEPAAPAMSRHRNRMREWFAERMTRARGEHRTRDEDATTDAADATTAADDERLLSLRQPDDARQAYAELMFIAGPRKGEAIRIGQTVITLGEAGESDEPLADAAAVGARYGRIWQQGDHFIFRQLDDADVKISGEQLLIPVVVLEHGDQIAYGDHVLEFNQQAV